MSTQPASSGTELKLVGRVLNTIGVVFLSICVAMVGALYDNISAMDRTMAGLAVAAAMVMGGEFLYRRLKNNWFPTTVMSAGYALAYFFIYSTYYVPGLHMLNTPYACWILGPALGAIGTFHGSKNKSMRWFASIFTLVVTGHASYHALSNTTMASLGGLSIQVSAIGCFLGMLWCASLSTVYKHFELNYSWPGKDFEESSNWMLNRVLHEAYFVFAALNAMALPIFLSHFEQAPLWWSLQAPILLAISWRTGNYIKHGAVGAMWAAAAATLVSNALHHSVQLPVLVTVPLTGLAISMAYRFLKSTMAENLKVSGYCGYLYGAMGIAVLLPYLQFNTVLLAMPVWMIEGLVLAGLGLALQDRTVHKAGMVTGLGALVLFGYQYDSWSWGLAAPVIACAYGLSVAYGRIGTKGGWPQTKFLPFGGETVSKEGAAWLEQLWSWTGCATLLAASFLLINHGQTVIYWSVEALLLVVLGFAAAKVSYRLQGLLAFTAAAGKLVIWDMSVGLGWDPALIFTLFRAAQFGAVGATSLLSSFLYFREEARLEAGIAAANTPATAVPNAAVPATALTGSDTDPETNK